MRKIKKLISILLLVAFSSVFCAKEKDDKSGFIAALLLLLKPNDTSQSMEINMNAKFYSESGEVLKNIETEKSSTQKSLVAGELPSLNKADSNGDVKLNLKQGVNQFLIKTGGSVLGKIKLIIDAGKVIKQFKSSSSVLYELEDGTKSRDAFYFPLKDGEYKTTDFSGNENCFLNDYWGNSTYHDGCDYFRTDTNSFPEVFSSSDGEVVKKYSSCTEGDQIGCNGGLGNLVVIKSYGFDGQVNYFVYWHLSSVNPNIGVGKKVSHQDLLGRMGSTGSRGGKKKYGVHLHYKVMTTLDYEAWGYDDKESIEENYKDPSKIGLIDRGSEYKSFYEIEPSITSIQQGNQITITYKTLGSIKRIVLAFKRDIEKGTTPNENYYKHDTELSNTGSVVVTIPSNLAIATDWRIYLRDVESGIFNSSIGLLNILSGGGTTTSNVAPTNLTYLGSPYTFTNGVTITTQTPTVTGTITTCAASPSLPTGLSLNTTSCAISGTPTANQTATSHTVTASNSFGNTTATISITVNNAPPSNLTYTGSPYTFTNGVGITSITPTVTGTVTSCTASPSLPTGLSLNTTTCAISGTPTVNQTATSHTVTASNSFGNTTATISIKVNNAPPSNLTYTSSPYTFTNGVGITTITPTATGTITTCNATPSLPTGLNLNTTTCAFSGTPTANQTATSHTITASNNGGSTTATISITVNNAAPSNLTYTGSPYTFTNGVGITTITPTAIGTVTGCTASPSLPTGLNLNTTTCAISGTPTANQTATSHIITASNSFGNTTATISITVNYTAPTNLMYSGSPYTFTNGIGITTKTPTVTGTVTGCTASPSLPTGLNLNTTTCAISGTPTANQVATVHTVTASNSAGNTTTTINITVNYAAPTNLTYSGSPYTFTNGVGITTKTPAVTGTVTGCTASPSLPTGLSLNTSSCAISGTPTSNQAATSHTITASNNGGSTTATISITVNNAAPSNLTYTGSPYTFTNGVGITTITPTVTGTVTSCTASPNLPTGLNLNTTTCAISGTPTANQTATSHTITASNNGGSTTATISITVNSQQVLTQIEILVGFAQGGNSDWGNVWSVQLYKNAYEKIWGNVTKNNGSNFKGGRVYVTTIETNPTQIYNNSYPSDSSSFYITVIDPTKFKVGDNYLEICLYPSPNSDGTTDPKTCTPKDLNNALKVKRNY